MRDPSFGELAGRLEYYYEGQWGSVCDDDFDANPNAAQVACRNLGLPWTDADHYDAQGPDDQPTWLDNVRCMGDEYSILDCDRNDIGNENCAKSEDIGLICRGDAFSGSGN